MPQYTSKTDKIIDVDTRKSIQSIPENYETFAEVITPNGREKYVGEPTVIDEGLVRRQRLTQNLPVATNTPNSIINQKYEAQEAMANALLDKRYANAGVVGNDFSQADPIKLRIAEAQYMNDMSDLISWHRNIRNKLNAIDKADNFTPDEKRIIRDKIIGETKDAIYIPDMSEAQLQTQPNQLSEKDKTRKLLQSLITGETTQGIEEDLQVSDSIPSDIKPATTAVDLLNAIEVGAKRKKSSKQIKTTTEKLYDDLAEQLNFAGGIWHKQTRADVAAYHARAGFEKGEKFIPTGTIVGKGSQMEITPKELSILKDLDEESMAEAKAVLYSGNPAAIRELINKIKEITKEK